MAWKKKDQDVEDEELEEELDEAEEDDEVYVSEHRLPGFGGFIIGMLVGAMAGATAAVLLAPARGDVTRRRIKYRVRDIADDALDQVDTIKDDAERRISRARRRLVRKR